MGARQHLAAGRGIAAEIARRHDLELRLDLGVAQLPDIEVTAGRAGGEAQQHVARGLQQALAAHHPFAVMGKRAGAGMGLEHRAVRFLELQV